MTTILGISAFYHDSAAALVVDGEIVAAAQEERFTRKKHDHEFPVRAIEFCLAEGGLKPDQLDLVGFYDKPFLKFERLLETYLAFVPMGFRSFLLSMPLWLRQKLHLPREIRRGLQGGYRNRCVFTEHHESHAASAFFPSPFEEAAILTVDGVGEWATASFGVGRGNSITLTHEQRFPHSLGLLYSAFTYFCGFRVNSGEYKLMGLAPYGEPKYEDLIREKLLDLKADGSFRLDLSYFDFCAGLTMTSSSFARLFGGPPRSPEASLTQREMDLAASIQNVTEDIMLRTVRHLHEQTGMDNLCLAGGVALNCVGNGRILTEGPFRKLWIQPAAGDAGGALGTALFIWHQLLGHERKRRTSDTQRGSLLGPKYSNEQIRAFLDGQKAIYRYFDEEDELCRHVAGLIASEKVVGWLQGRVEFGPRALGNRSILGDARSRNMQSVMNLKIKFRESFRPFAPVVLRERASEYFELDGDVESPYMLLVAPVKHEKRVKYDASGAAGLEKLKKIRSCVPAITHVDYSARVQTVDSCRHGRFYKLLKAFDAQTDCPVMINTSFNVRGEPIVCSPEHAYRCFMATNMDVLVLENYVLLKQEQPAAKERSLDSYLAQFSLD
ncbi:MAG: carbamoyltransferase [Thermoguttaceae bacterium]